VRTHHHSDEWKGLSHSYGWDPFWCVCRLGYECYKRCAAMIDSAAGDRRSANPIARLDPLLCHAEDVDRDDDFVDLTVGVLL
jgi:hypothetical protein